MKFAIFNMMRDYFFILAGDCFILIFMMFHDLVSISDSFKQMRTPENGYSVHSLTLVGLYFNEWSDKVTKLYTVWNTFLNCAC